MDPPVRLGRWTFRALVLVSTLVAGAILGGCGGRGGGDGQPGPPPPIQLAGLRMMLMPAPLPAPTSLDPELAFWLEEQFPTAEWISPAELQEAADRSPAWRVRLNTLPRPVGESRTGGLRVLDPLYGVLRRLGAVVDAEHALVPVAVSTLDAEEGVRMAMTVAVVNVRGARVLWLHTLTGEPAADPEAAAASAAEKLARVLGGGAATPQESEESGT